MIRRQVWVCLPLSIAFIFSVIIQYYQLQQTLESNSAEKKEVFVDKITMMNIVLNQLVKMEGEGIANLSGKITSAQGNFSTLDSIQATIKQAYAKQSQYGGKVNYSSDLTQEIQNKKTAHHFEKVQNQCQSRLFTFMDERDCEKLFIQNYFLRTIHQLPSEDKENHHFVLNQANSHPSKKQEYFLQINRQSIQKLAVKKQPSKLSKSNNSKISTLQRAKTPKLSKIFLNTKTSVSPRQYQKSLKSRNNRSITPKYIKQNRMLGICSNLDDQNSSDKITNKWRKKQLTVEQQSEQMERKRNINIKKEESVKSLVKKKKELQKQLTLINDSLVSLKRKNDIRNKIEGTAKIKRKQQSCKARKSFTKLSKKS